MYSVGECGLGRAMTTFIINFISKSFQFLPICKMKAYWPSAACCDYYTREHWCWLTCTCSCICGWLASILRTLWWPLTAAIMRGVAPFLFVELTFAPWSISSCVASFSSLDIQKKKKKKNNNNLTTLYHNVYTQGWLGHIYLYVCINLILVHSAHTCRHTGEEACLHLHPFRKGKYIVHVSITE